MRSAITTTLSNVGSRNVLPCGDVCPLRSGRPIVSNENEPATKKDLADLTTKLASKDDLAAMEKRLVLEIRHAANVMIEKIGAKIAVIVEKHDGPVRQVRADLDAHRADFSLHTRPAPSPPKRTSRRKPLRPR